MQSILNSGSNKWTFKSLIIEGRATISTTSSVQDDGCLLYTSDAADERSSVDLGGRRIIKKKKDESIRTCTIVKK